MSIIINNFTYNIFKFSGSVGVPGTLLCVYFIRFGRRNSIFISAIVAGAACLLLTVIPAGQQHHLPLVCIAFFNPRQNDLGAARGCSIKLDVNP